MISKSVFCAVLFCFFLSCILQHGRFLGSAVYLNALGMIVIMTLAGMAGLTMFAYYVNCDPYAAGWVSASDQLMPYFTMDILYDYPGLPGVYLCSAFSGTLR